MTAIEPAQDREDWQVSDDYGAVWRNPTFREAADATGARERIRADRRCSRRHSGVQSATAGWGRA